MTIRLAYTTATAAEATSRSRQTILRAIHSGALRAKRENADSEKGRGGNFLILHADLVAWLEGLTDA